MYVFLNRGIDENIEAQFLFSMNKDRNYPIYGIPYTVMKFDTEGTKRSDVDNSH